MEKEVSNNQWQELIALHLEKAKNPLLVLLGPTASGKTAFSLEVAKWIVQSSGHRVMVSPSNHGTYASPFDELRVTRTEIINADSRQLYKYMDVGTAKITAEEMGGIPHHLFSVLDPKEKVTAGWYKQEAEEAISAILARGNVPILVGGSMLYISAVTDGYVFTGRGGKCKSPIPYDLLILGMRWPREELVKRIEERTKKLLGLLPPSPAAAGEGTGERAKVMDWLQEVEWLLANGYTASDPGMESCGYREIAAWILNGKKEEEFPQIIESINAATRQYAKRQCTWWRHDKRIQWISFSL